MIACDFDNCMAENVGQVHGVSKDDLASLAPKLTQAFETFQQWRTSGEAIFFDLPDKDGYSAGVAEKAKEVAARYDNLVVLGIGGSALGTRAIANALLHPLHNFLSREERKKVPRLFICDNIDPTSFAALLDHLDLRTTCFNVISKSGKTTETMAQFFLVVERLKTVAGSSWREQVIVTTDPESGELRDIARREELTAFSIPASLGGRYSVLSPVTLFPAACVGVYIDGLLEGGREAARVCEKKDIAENPALKLAAISFLLDTQHHKHLAVMMPYTDRLVSFAQWYAQLWAESLGKNGKGTTPVPSLGATDQHSQLQLFMDGPNDKFIQCIRVKDFSVEKEKCTVKTDERTFLFLHNKTLFDILHAEQQATMSALTKAHRPNMTITLPDLTAQSLGELLFMYEAATAFAGALYGVNPFTQPAVQLTKTITRKFLLS